MKLRLALAAVFALPLAATTGVVVEDLLASLSLPQAVRLADGSVLPAGPYDVQIHYKGFGNAAELWFFQKGQIKGKSPAEARGFPSTEPGALAWDKAGFRAGQKGTVTPAPPGKLRLSFDSANSAAGFIAILPYIEKGRK